MGFRDAGQVLPSPVLAWLAYNPAAHHGTLISLEAGQYPACNLKCDYCINRFEEKLIRN